VIRFDQRGHREAQSGYVNEPLQRLIIPFTCRAMRIACSHLVGGMICSALVFGCAGQGRTPPAAAVPSRSDFGRDSGYVWVGRVTSLEASWIVPLVTEQPLPGASGTWIGAEAYSTHARAFIQVGTSEEQTASANGPTSERYHAFWSDKAHSFLPIFLFDVTPATEVTARLTLSRGRWEVFIRDSASGQQARFTTPQEANGSFGTAMWLQEAVGPARSGNPVDRVRFTSLRVDGKEPGYAQMLSEWMTDGARNLAPSPLVSDSFEIAPASTSYYGSEYLRIAKEANVRSAEIRAELRSPEALASSDSRSNAARTKLADVLERFGRELKAVHWPRGAAAALNAVQSTNETAVTSLRSHPGATARDRAWWETVRARAAQASQAAVRYARRVLGLPQIEPE
jgi:hypothetical protein